MEPAGYISFRPHGTPSIVKSEPDQPTAGGPPQDPPLPTTSPLHSALDHAKTAADQALTLLAEEATQAAIGRQFEPQLISLIGQATLFKSSCELEQQVR